MAKKKADTPEQEPERITRREVLRARKLAEQQRQVRLVVGAVVGVLALIVVVGLVIEFIVIPRQAVAEVKGETITMREWRDRVRFERARFLIDINSQFETFSEPNEGQDPEQARLQAINFVQQFSGQQLSLLSAGYEQLGEGILEQMVDETLIRQGAEARGLTVTEDEIDAIIGERFNFYGGGLPTPIPTEDLPEPTPSVTPIGFEAPEELADGPEFPTPTPRPTNTPVSQEAFQTEFDTELSNLAGEGANTDLYRETAAIQLYRDKLADALMVEEEVVTEDVHATFYIITFEDEASALRTEQAIEESDFLTAWNTARSQPTDEEGNPSPVQANELFDRTRDSLEAQFSNDLLDAIFEAPVGEVGGPFEVSAGDGTSTLFMVQVTGRELKPLDDVALNQKKQEVLRDWLQEQRLSDVTILDNWRTRIPRQPSVDAEFLAPVVVPTSTPPPAIPLPEEPAPETDE